MFGFQLSNFRQNDSIGLRGDPMAGDICAGRFAWECTEESCCSSYHQRVLLLFFSVGVFLVALIVLIGWLLIDFRPSRIRRTPEPVGRDKRLMSEVEVKSFEETKYLRRMSELNPNRPKEII